MAPAHELMEGEGHLVGMRCTPGYEAFELDGIVNNRGDKEMAFIRANGVPGVFSVKSNLQVANQPSESQKTANP